MKQPDDEIMQRALLPCSDEPGNEAVLLLALDVVEQVLAYLAEVVVYSVVVADHQRVVPLYRVLSILGSSRVVCY